MYTRACHGPTLVGPPGVGLGRAGRPGPAHQLILWGAAARPGPSNFQRMGRGPARPINFSEDWPRPGPAHHTVKHLRPGPAHHFFESLGPARPGPTHHLATRPMRPGLCIGWHDNYAGRPMCCPVLKDTCAYADLFFYVNEC